MNTWTIPLVRYSEPFFKQTREELRQIDQKTRKLMIHKALHLRDDIDKVYMSRKGRGTGLTSIKDKFINMRTQRQH